MSCFMMSRRFLFPLQNSMKSRAYSSVGSDIPLCRVLKKRDGGVFKVNGSSTVCEAAKAMASINVGSALVVSEDETKVYGIVTERDILRKVVVPGLDPSITPVKEVSSTNLIGVNVQKTVSDAMTILTSKGLRHLPVIKDGEVVDVLSIRDLVAAIHENNEAEMENLKDFVLKQGHNWAC